MYFVQDSHGFWNWLYFIILIVVSILNSAHLCLGTIFVCKYCLIDSFLIVCLLQFSTILPRDRSLPPQPISARKVQPRKKSPQTFAHLMNFPNKPCFIIIECCFFDYGINRLFTCSRCIICVSRFVHVISTYYVC